MAKDMNLLQTFQTKSGRKIAPYLLDWTDPNEISKKEKFKLRHPSDVARSVSRYFKYWDDILESKKRSEVGLAPKKTERRGGNRYQIKKKQIINLYHISCYRWDIANLIEKYLEFQGIVLDNYQKRRLKFVLKNEAYRRSLVYLFDKDVGVIGFIQNVLCFLYTKSAKFLMFKQINKWEEDIRKIKPKEDRIIINKVKNIVGCSRFGRIQADKEMLKILETRPQVTESLSEILSKDATKIPEGLKITLLHFFIDQSIRKEISKAIPSYLLIIGDKSH